MGKKSKTFFGQRPEKLARLLTTCAGASMSPDKSNTEQQKADLLRDLLEDVLPAEPAVIDALPVIVRHLCRELLPLAGESLGKLLLTPETDISSIEKIKNYGKKVSGSTDSEVEYETSAIIYYAAIASALVFHDQKITEYSYGELVHWFSMLMDKKWMPPEISKLFTKAREICQQKAGGISTEPNSE